MGLNHSPQLTPFLVKEGIFREGPFSLVDVGCSGGIQQHWRHFGDSLTAVGFDPLVKEVERLNSVEQNPAVRYVASLVGCRGMPTAIPEGAFDADFYHRTSTVRARELLRCNVANTYLDQTHEGILTSELVELDEYFHDHPGNVDFVKTDTDGHDIVVLLGGRELLSSVGPIGLAVEVGLLGRSFPHANLYSNADTYLQALGYSVCSIEPRSHSRAALPKPFRWCGPWDTHAGQVHWADTLYFRDVCIPNYEKKFRVELTPHKLLKLCCTYELFSLEDCAAEVLIQFRDRLGSQLDVDHCLDLLTPPLPDGRKVSYREYIDFFEKNVSAFYSGN